MKTIQLIFYCQCEVTSHRRRACRRRLPVGVLLRREEEGVIGGVTGGVRFPPVWRGGVETLLRDRLPDRDRDSLGCTLFFSASSSRLAASVMNLASSNRKRITIRRESSIKRVSLHSLSGEHQPEVFVALLLSSVCWEVKKKKNTTGYNLLKKKKPLEFIDDG